MESRESPLVSVDWLAAHVDDPDVVVADCRWYLAPFDERDPDVEYTSGHIPGASQMRWDRDYHDPEHELDGMLAPPDRFASAMGAAGIGDDTFVVAYDDNHVTVAARLWWALRVNGHAGVAVLDGGIDAWAGAGLALSTVTPDPVPRVFTARERSALYARKEDVLAAVGDDAVQLVDGRMLGAYQRDGGSVPGSIRLPGIEFVDTEGRWPTGDEAGIRIDEQRGRDADRVIAYCTGGVGACGTALAYALAGREDVAVYDGSWLEWGPDPGTPKIPNP